MTLLQMLKRIISYVQLYANKFDNLEEMYKFLKRHRPKLAQEGRIILHFQTPTDEFEIETKFLKSITLVLAKQCHSSKN